MENYCKKWDLKEDEMLMDEINNLLELEFIANTHKRSTGGIVLRIQRIIDDPNLFNKLQNKNDIILKYFKKNKLTNKTNLIDLNDLYNNLLNFNSIDNIINKYNSSKDNVIKVLNNMLNSSAIELSKKLRIKFLLSSLEEDNTNINKNSVITKININNEIDNNYKFNKTNNVTNKTNTLLPNQNTTNANNNETNIILQNILLEIKSIKTDLFDVRNRVKVIMDKVDKIEKSNIPSKIIKNKIINDNKIIENEIEKDIEIEKEFEKFLQ
jgi:hypothetical protein